MTTTAASVLPDAHNLARTELDKMLTSWFQDNLHVRLGKRILASLRPVIDQYAEACEKFAIAQELGPMREQLADTKGALDTYLENKCPKCSEFVHPRAKRCGTCVANAAHEMYTKELLTMSEQLRMSHRRRDELLRHVELAMKALTHGRRAKKKAKFVRQALAILEAATTEDHPQLDKTLGSLGAVGLLGALAFPLMGYFLKRDRKTPNGPPSPPTPEEAACAIP